MPCDRPSIKIYCGDGIRNLERGCDRERREQRTERGRGGEQVRLAGNMRELRKRVEEEGVLGQ